MSDFKIVSKGLEGYSLDRKEPSVESLGKAKKSELESYVSEYSDFLDSCRTPNLVTDWAISAAKENGFKRSVSYTGRAKSFYLDNEDHTTFALVRMGSAPLREGLRIICTHTDAPALQIKPKPILFNIDYLDQQLHLGVELDTFPYGCINPYQWFARDVDIIGWTVKNGRRRKIKFSGFIPDLSVHIDNRVFEREEMGDAFKSESLDIVTGHTSFKDLLKSLGFSCEEDFARSRLWAVPRNDVLRTGNLLNGYGHDDRSCTYAAVKAMLACDNPYYTTLALCFDKEEVDSPGKDAAKGNFFERVVCLIAGRHGIKPSDITAPVMYSIYEKSLVFSGDLDIGSAKREVDLSRVDVKNIPRLGYGAFVSACDGAYAGNQVSPVTLDKVLGILDKAKIRRQVIGSPHPSDEMDQSGSMAEFFTNRGLRTINVGIPAVSLHSPCETIHVGDFYWMIKAYESFLSGR